jgi:uncharacterized protein (TIGR00725 family)
VSATAADRLYVAVVGAGKPDSRTDGAAEQVGRLLAERGAAVVCGGLGGVMEAASRGARSAGGMTIGLLPGPDRRGANPHLEVSIPTGMGELRNGLIARAADALIAIGGEFGTLSEIGLALKLGRPVVGLGSWELAKEGSPVEAVEVAADPADAVERALARARDRPA